MDENSEVFFRDLRSEGERGHEVGGQRARRGMRSGYDRLARDLTIDEYPYCI